MENRLGHATSPYLLQHADNPVAWQPWDDEALQAARDQDKPIFLSIGYAACHWCHVMAHESFEDPDTAAILNEHFISIKVDREERPDVDAVYMDAVMALTGGGGWPMSVFLTPEGDPFYGGTYFPPEPRHNLPGFGELLTEIAKRWREDRRSLLDSSDELGKHLRRAADPTRAVEPISTEVIEQALARLHATYDWRDGGWGNAPKFPQPAAIDFLMTRYASEGDRLARDIALHALRAMASGGMYDQLAGGFSRYSVDGQWLVPHFEKMLYDNALLLENCVRAWQVSGDDFFKSIADQTFAFMNEVMRAEDGAYFASLDADTDGEEGKYYLWKSGEIDEVLGEAAPLFRRAYGVTEEGNFEGHNVLHRAEKLRVLAQEFSLDRTEVSLQLQEAGQRLLARRRQRTRPAVDDKLLCGWNGLMLIALAAGAAAFGEAAWLESAQRLARYLNSEMRKDGRLQRSRRGDEFSGPGFLEDHAAAGLGLLALYQVDFNPDWYQAAVAEAEFILAHFRHPQAGFFDTSDDADQLIHRPKSLQDSPTPSGNALATRLLLQLYSLTGLEEYLHPAEQAIRSMVSPIQRHPTAFSSWLRAADFLLGPQPQLAIVGDPSAAGFQALAAVAHQRFTPRLVLAGGQPPQTEPALLRDRTLLEEQAAAYLCRDFTCQLPTNSPEDLLRQLWGST